MVSSARALASDGTLFAGAHDHLRFVHAENGVTYFHSGCWNSHASIVRLFLNPDGTPRWEVEQVVIDASVPADDQLAALVAAQLQEHLTAEDRAVVTRLPAAATRRSGC